MTIYNFSAGPAMLPAAVLKKAQAELLDWQGRGISVMEVSHRSPEYIALAEEAEQNLRDLMSIPDNYAVLFMHGGGRNHFSSVPLNIADESATVDYVTTGSWSQIAFDEAKKYVRHVNLAAQTEETPQGKAIPLVADWQLSDGAAYVHYCPNETVDGIALHEVPDVAAPLVADMSSVILAEPLDVSKFGVIYAGAQKNIGPSGFSVVIIRKDLLATRQSRVCTVMNYQVQAAEKSMYNTPNTWAWYLSGEVFKWLQREGGVAAMGEQNHAKARLLYECIDNNPFYRNQVHPRNRSIMNIPFQLAKPELDNVFLSQAAEQGLIALKGHRFVGGMRASMYNAMPYAGAQALVDFMTRFAQQHG
ncbi:3-phosphoserine/phosphohydroxythreonine transaminase [Aliidiomarina maris]|uniref:Phosphoserine aminotransferase n=1 Tax=Aliidiomarina maris TaxID=531312 RepID=A0A327WZC8_9GAMM|nr:3-phosphoserine/phosphohydroxythreonine transaminase [Aliidiomarina maris]RAJ98851.1 phosphoserine aminotransferase [Aliidiomarina maris]RUO24998.1 phosphoserine transaminase [Aliidiomarina maris]